MQISNIIRLFLITVIIISSNGCNHGNDNNNKSKIACPILIDEVDSVITAKISGDVLCNDDIIDSTQPLIIEVFRYAHPSATVEGSGHFSIETRLGVSIETTNDKSSIRSTNTQIEPFGIKLYRGKSCIYTTNYNNMNCTIDPDGKANIDVGTIEVNERR